MENDKRIINYATASPFFSKPNFQTNAAATAPKIGATKKSQSWLSALPPAKSAGPKLRAGFTEVPVTGIATRWMSTNVIPIARPAMLLFPSLDVVPKITIRKINVNMNSVTKAEVIL